MAKGYKQIYKFDRTKNNQALSSVLRHRITIEQPANSSDGEGGMVAGWVKVGVTWASVDPISAKQKTDFSSISTEITHLVKVRGNVICKDTYQLQFDGRTFEILTVENIQERDILKIIMCKERSR